ncbi:hypothetical protein C7408_12426 [Paraburkholderia caballeronis]|nr:hypothetical protein C7408_12426 [Paraburkholderia caballeronis]TDV09585.1 hypothetical protein C7406_12626 [Paraburkholderia caballeronis]TDV21650.1 hypothetical protein C7404_12126 [Paraburkholderia caballeronis]
MKVGTVVILIGTDGYMPPIGSYGEIVEPLDMDGDYGVLFPLHPCQNPPGIHWYARGTWLLPVSGLQTDALSGCEVPT